jgi:hypothetical protein
MGQTVLKMVIWYKPRMSMHLFPSSVSCYSCPPLRLFRFAAVTLSRLLQYRWFPSIISFNFYPHSVSRVCNLADNFYVGADFYVWGVLCVYMLGSFLSSFIRAHPISVFPCVFLSTLSCS